MRYISIINQGPDYSLTLAEREQPTVGTHEVLIKVAAIGVNRADLFQAQGMYPPPKGASDILGLEVSGDIVSMGNDAKMHSVGDKVCALIEGGGYAEYVVAHESMVLPIPKGVALKDAASIPETLTTCYLNILELGQLRPEETLLVHGGASGVGVMAIQLAKIFNARIFATAGTDEKCKLCETLGAEKAINYTTEDFADSLKEIDIDLIIDMVGGNYLNRNLTLLKQYGRLVMIAVLGGAKTEINLASVLMKNITIIGSTLRSRSSLEKHQLMRSIHATIWPLFEVGQIKPIIDSRFVFADAQKAHEHMRANKNLGKIILEI